MEDVNFSKKAGVALSLSLSFLLGGSLAGFAAESKTQAKGMQAQMLPPMGPAVNPVNNYDPNAKAWPITRPKWMKPASNVHEGSVREDVTVPSYQSGSARAGSFSAPQSSLSGSASASAGASGGANYKGSFVNGKFVLQGGVEEKVPQTPDAVADYLRRMKAIINQFNQSILSMMSGGMLQADNAEAAKGSLVSFITRVRTTVPPAQLKDAHAALADAMGYMSQIIDQTSTNPMGAMMSVMSFQSRWFAAFDRYHSGVKNCIAYYNLSPSLDPCADGTDAQKQQALNAIPAMEAQKMNELSNPGGSGGMGGMGGMGGGDLGALGGMLGGMGGGGMGGGGGGASPNLGSLMNMLGGAGGGGGGGGSPDIGSLMKMMGGAGGMGGGSGMGGGNGMGGGMQGMGGMGGFGGNSGGLGNSNSDDLGL